MSSPLPPHLPLRTCVLACLGIFAGVSLLAFTSFDLHVALVLGSFGSTAILLFAFPDNEFSQPRCVLGGHLIGVLVGLSSVALFGQVWWALGAAVAISAALMMWTRTLHPPAGSNAIVVFMTQPAWDFVWFPTMTGAAALVVSAWCFHRSFKRRYPLYWIGGKGGH